MTHICKYYQYGFCKKKFNCNLKHVKEECNTNNCDKKTCEKRHRIICKYFEKYGRCKFGFSCEYKHEVPAYIERIDILEDKIRKYDEDYNLFLKFFKNSILEKLDEIQNKVKEETKVLDNLKSEVLIMQNDIEERRKMLSTFNCFLCKKVFKKDSFLERHIIKVHNINIPQADGFEDTIDDSISELFEPYPYARCTECDITFENNDQVEEHDMKIHIPVVGGSYTWFCCSICGEEFAFLKRIKPHMLKDHQIFS